MSRSSEISAARGASAPHPNRVFAVIPAAGHSRRMGRPKLLLPFGSSTVIGAVLEVLRRPGITEVVVVVRRDDHALRTEAAEHGAIVVCPGVDPPDMRASVAAGLEDVRRRHVPGPDEAWLLIPADHPLLDARLLDLVLQRWGTGSDTVLIPTFEGRRGHPTLLRWKCVAAIAELPADQGLNRLLRAHPDWVTELPVEYPAAVLDLDTPADYAALLAANRTSQAPAATGDAATDSASASR